jgi:DNA-binding ferritin-like protein
VTRADEESEKERVWRVLSEAGLIDIPPDEFAERIKEAKHVVMGRLSELLEQTTDIQEREAAAYSLATLKELERTVSRSGRRSSD